MLLYVERLAKESHAGTLRSSGARATVNREQVNRAAGRALEDLRLF